MPQTARFDSVSTMLYGKSAYGMSTCHDLRLLIDREQRSLHFCFMTLSSALGCFCAYILIYIFAEINMYRRVIDITAAIGLRNFLNNHNAKTGMPMLMPVGITHVKSVAMPIPLGP